MILAFSQAVCFEIHSQQIFRAVTTVCRTAAFSGASLEILLPQLAQALSDGGPLSAALPGSLQRVSQAAPVLGRSLGVTSFLREYLLRCSPSSSRRQHQRCYSRCSHSHTVPYRPFLSSSPQTLPLEPLPISPLVLSVEILSRVISSALLWSSLSLGALQRPCQLIPKAVFSKALS